MKLSLVLLLLALAMGLDHSLNIKQLGGVWKLWEEVKHEENVFKDWTQKEIERMLGAQRPVDNGEPRFVMRADPDIEIPEHFDARD
jgi:hypothetical protein